MKSFESYYDGQVSLSDTAKALSDPNLSLDKNREDVDVLSLNLVIKFIAAYLEVSHTDINMIGDSVRAAYEKDPEDVLRFILQSLADMRGLKVESNLVDSDLLALESLLDVRATAVLVREIVFNQNFDTSNFGYVGVDLGSGTGILTLASIIAGRRRQIRSVTVLGVDNQKSAINKSKRVLSGVANGQFILQHGDILDPGLYDVFRGIPVQSWVSETISEVTPRMRFDGDDVVVSPVFGKHVFRDLHADPFPHVLNRTLQGIPSFVAGVKSRRTAMFPDLVNGFYRPDMLNSKLVLRSSDSRTPRSLPDVGDDLNGYEDFGIHSRWPAYDPNEEVNPVITGIVGTFAKEFPYKK